MNKTILVVLSAFLLLGVLAGCSHSNDSGNAPCTPVPVANDSTALLSFAKTNGLTPVKDSTGLYYQVITPGTGANITINSVVNVTYTGTLLNGNIFDSTTTATRGFPLSGLIQAWQIGLQKIKIGGHIKLLVPSAMGYGCAGSPPVIPANAPLYFDVTVVSGL